MHGRGGPGGRCGPWGAAWGPGPREGRESGATPSRGPAGPRVAQSWVTRTATFRLRAGRRGGVPGPQSPAAAARGPGESSRGNPSTRKVHSGRLGAGGRSEEDRGAARRVPAAGFRDPRIPRTGASGKACSRASARADPRFAGEPLGRVGVRPRELPLYSCCERGGAARGGRGHCHFKSGEVRPPEVMVTSASSPPPAREREREEREGERERRLVFIHNFFLFLPLRQLFIPRSSQRGLQRAQLHRGNRRCGDTAPPPGPPARCAPAL